jgi:hypothetical protein
MRGDENMYKRKNKRDMWINALTARLFWVLCVIICPFVISYYSNISLSDAYFKFLTIVPTELAVPAICFIAKRIMREDGFIGNIIDFIAISAADICMVVRVYCYLKFMS